MVSTGLSVPTPRRLVEFVKKGALALAETIKTMEFPLSVHFISQLLAS